MSEKKELTFWQKVENIWYYNKLFIIAGTVLSIIFVAGLFALISEYRERPTDLRLCTIYSDATTFEDYTIAQKLADSLQDINGDDKIEIKYTDYYIIPGSQTDDNMMSQGRFEATLEACMSDIMLFDKTNLDAYIKKDIFSPIGDYLDLSTISDEDIIYRNDIAVAVKLSDSKLLKEVNYNTDEIYMSVLFLPENADEKTLAYRQNTKIAVNKLIEK